MKKTNLFILVAVVVLTAILLAACSKAGNGPTISISKPSMDAVSDGGTLSYDVSVDGDKVKFNLDPANVMLNGFKAEVQIEQVNDNTIVVNLFNIQNAAGNVKYISLEAGIASDKHGKSSDQKSSPAFKIF